MLSWLKEKLLVRKEALDESDSSDGGEVSKPPAQQEVEAACEAIEVGVEGEVKSQSEISTHFCIQESKQGEKHHQRNYAKVEGDDSSTINISGYSLEEFIDCDENKKFVTRKSPLNESDSNDGGDILSTPAQEEVEVTYPLQINTTFQGQVRSLNSSIENRCLEENGGYVDSDDNSSEIKVSGNNKEECITSDYVKSSRDDLKDPKNKNSSSFDENSSNYDKNSRSFDKNSSSFDKNSSIFDKNSSSFDKNSSIFDKDRWMPTDKDGCKAVEGSSNKVDQRAEMTNHDGCSNSATLSLSSGSQTYFSNPKLKQVEESLEVKNDVQIYCLNPKLKQVEEKSEVKNYCTKFPSSSFIDDNAEAKQTYISTCSSTYPETKPSLPKSHDLKGPAQFGSVSSKLSNPSRTSKVDYTNSALSLLGISALDSQGVTKGDTHDGTEEALNTEREKVHAKRNVRNNHNRNEETLGTEHNIMQAGETAINNRDKDPHQLTISRGNVCISDRADKSFRNMLPLDTDKPYYHGGRNDCHTTLNQTYADECIDIINGIRESTPSSTKDKTDSSSVNNENSNINQVPLSLQEVKLTSISINDLKLDNDANQAQKKRDIGLPVQQNQESVANSEKQLKREESVKEAQEEVRKCDKQEESSKGKRQIYAEMDRRSEEEEIKHYRGEKWREEKENQEHKESNRGATMEQENGGDGTRRRENILRTNENKHKDIGNKEETKQRAEDLAAKHHQITLSQSKESLANQTNKAEVKEDEEVKEEEKCSKVEEIMEELLNKQKGMIQELLDTDEGRIQDLLNREEQMINQLLNTEEGKIKRIQEMMNKDEGIIQELVSLEEGSLQEQLTREERRMQEGRSLQELLNIQEGRRQEKENPMQKAEEKMHETLNKEEQMVQQLDDAEGRQQEQIKNNEHMVQQQDDVKGQMQEQLSEEEQMVQQLDNAEGRRQEQINTDEQLTQKQVKNEEIVADQLSKNNNITEDLIIFEESKVQEHRNNSNVTTQLKSEARNVQKQHNEEELVEQGTKEENRPKLNEEKAHMGGVENTAQDQVQMPAGGSVPCCFPPAYLPPTCLYNQPGKLCTLLGDRYIVTRVNSAPVLVSTSITSNGWGVCGVVLLWHNGFPVVLKEVPDETDVIFDAVIPPQKTEFVALVIWQKAKPCFSIEPYFDGYIILNELHSLKVKLSLFAKEIGVISAIIQGRKQLIKFSKSVLYINGHKVGKTMDIAKFKNCEYGQLFADVCVLVTASVDTQVNYSFTCNCLWAGVEPLQHSLPQKFDYLTLYAKRSSNPDTFHVNKRQFYMHCDAQVELVCSENGWNLEYVKNGDLIKIPCSDEIFYCGNQRVMPTSGGKVTVHVRRYVNKKSSEYFRVVMVQIPESLVARPEAAQTSQCCLKKAASSQIKLSSSQTLTVSPSPHHQSVTTTSPRSQSLSLSGTTTTSLNSLITNIVSLSQPQTTSSIDQHISATAGLDHTNAQYSTSSQPHTFTHSPNAPSLIIQPPAENTTTKPAPVKELKADHSSTGPNTVPHNVKDSEGASSQSCQTTSNNVKESKNMSTNPFQSHTTPMYLILEGELNMFDNKFTYTYKGLKRCITVTPDKLLDQPVSPVESIHKFHLILHTDSDHPVCGWFERKTRKVYAEHSLTLYDHDYEEERLSLLCDSGELVHFQYAGFYVVMGKTMQPIQESISQRLKVHVVVEEVKSQVIMDHEVSKKVIFLTSNNFLCQQSLKFLALGHVYSDDMKLNSDFNLTKNQIQCQGSENIHNTSLVSLSVKDDIKGVTSPESATKIVGLPNKKDIERDGGRQAELSSHINSEKHNSSFPSNKSKFSEECLSEKTTPVDSWWLHKESLRQIIDNGSFGDLAKKRAVCFPIFEGEIEEVPRGKPLFHCSHLSKPLPLPLGIPQYGRKSDKTEKCFLLTSKKFEDGEMRYHPLYIWPEGSKCEPYVITVEEPFVLDTNATVLTLEDKTKGTKRSFTYKYDIAYTRTTGKSFKDFLESSHTSVYAVVEDFLPEHKAEVLIEGEILFITSSSILALTCISTMMGNISGDSSAELPGKPSQSVLSPSSKEMTDGTSTSEKITRSTVIGPERPGHSVTPTRQVVSMLPTFEESRVSFSSTFKSSEEVEKSGSNASEHADQLPNSTVVPGCSDHNVPFVMLAKASNLFDLTKTAQYRNKSKVEKPQETRVWSYLKLNQLVLVEGDYALLRATDKIVLARRLVTYSCKAKVTGPLTDLMKVKSGEVEVDAVVVPLPSPITVMGYTVTHEAMLAWLGGVHSRGTMMNDWSIDDCCYKRGFGWEEGNEKIKTSRSKCAEGREVNVDDLEKINKDDKSDLKQEEKDKDREANREGCAAGEKVNKDGWPELGKINRDGKSYLRQEEEEQYTEANREGCAEGKEVNKNDWPEFRKTNEDDSKRNFRREEMDEDTASNKEGCAEGKQRYKGNWLERKETNGDDHSRVVKTSGVKWHEEMNTSEMEHSDSMQALAPSDSCTDNIDTCMTDADMTENDDDEYNESSDVKFVNELVSKKSNLENAGERAMMYNTDAESASELFSLSDIENEESLGDLESDTGIASNSDWVTEYDKESDHAFECNEENQSVLDTNINSMGEELSTEICTTGMKEPREESLIEERQKVLSFLAVPPHPLSPCSLQKLDQTYGVLKSGTVYIMFKRKHITPQEHQSMTEADLAEKKLGAVIMKLSCPVSVLGFFVTSIALLVWSDAMPGNWEELIRGSLDLYREDWKVEFKINTKQDPDNSSLTVSKNGQPSTLPGRKLKQLKLHVENMKIVISIPSSIQSYPCRCVPVFADKDLVILRAKDMMILALKTNFFNDGKEVQPSSSLKKQLENLCLMSKPPTISVIPANLSKPLCLLKQHITHFAMVTFIGKKPAQCDDIVVKWKEGKVDKEITVYVKDEDGLQINFSFERKDQRPSKAASTTQQTVPVPVVKVQNQNPSKAEIKVQQAEVKVKLVQSNLTQPCRAEATNVKPNMTQSCKAKTANRVQTNLKSEGQSAAAVRLPKPVPVASTPQLTLTQVVNINTHCHGTTLYTNCAKVLKLMPDIGLLTVTNKSNEPIYIMFNRESMFINKEPLRTTNSLKRHLSPLTNQLFGCLAHKMSKMRNIINVEVEFRAFQVWYGEKPPRKRDKIEADPTETAAPKTKTKSASLSSLRSQDSVSPSEWLSPDLFPLADLSHNKDIVNII